MIQTGMSGFIGVTGLRPKATDMNAKPMLILRPKVPVEVEREIYLPCGRFATRGGLTRRDLDLDLGADTAVGRVMVDRTRTDDEDQIHFGLQNDVSARRIDGSDHMPSVEKAKRSATCWPLTSVIRMRSPRFTRKARPDCAGMSNVGNDQLVGCFD
jgi:hypothetical protein